MSYKICLVGSNVLVVGILVIYSLNCFNENFYFITLNILFTGTSKCIVKKIFDALFVTLNFTVAH